MRNVIILGITGSIGTTALRGCINNKESVSIIGVSCHTNVRQAVEICIQNDIPNLCVTSYAYFDSVPGLRIWTDLDLMLKELHADVVLNGISGSAGLQASIDTIDAGSDLALANKESVVLGGKLLFKYADEHKSRIIPVDSEHSAIDELIRTNKIENTSRLIITASGGPFLNTPEDELDSIVPSVAVKHPTWNMGPKISIDSSTLANKGLEVIEAHFLFGFDTQNIEVVIHPQSIVHSMIRTVSGQVYAQMSPPDMTFPIMRALLDGKFTKPVGADLDFINLNLTFRAIDFNQFPFVKDAFFCAREEGLYPMVYNIADEIAVSDYMSGKIKYTGIYNFVKNALELQWNDSISDIHDIVPMLEEIRKRITV